MLAPAGSDTSAVLAPIVAARARVLAPAVWLALVFFVAAAEPLGIRTEGGAQALEWAICTADGVLTILLLVRRVPPRLIHIASSATLAFPLAATILALYATHDLMLAVLAVLQIASAGVLLETVWTIATVLGALAFVVPAVATSGSPYAPLVTATLITASLFALLIHTLMRRALVREARTARELAHKLAEHARLQDQLVHAQRMEAVGTLAAGIAHDMNNVLGSIRSLATLVAEDQSTPSDELRQILSQADRGAALTRGLLAFSRRGQYRKQIVRIANVVGDVMPLLERTLPKTLAIRAELEFGNACIEADPAHIVQVLVNLGVNAADATPGPGTLTIRGDVVAGRARLRVTDTGQGMDEATRRRVFEPFFTTKPLGSGTGLGLSTVWGIVQAHDGAIEVESEPGRGTTFTVSLPLSAGSPTPVPRRLGTGPIDASHRVLVVDDEPAIRHSTRRLLERIGIAVEVAADGAEALRILDARGGAFDLVILDMGMPVMGGSECFRRIRDKSDIPVLIATGYAVDQDAQQLIAAGARILEKPFPAEELRREVARMLASTSQQVLS